MHRARRPALFGLLTVTLVAGTLVATSDATIAAPAPSGTCGSVTAPFDVTATGLKALIHQAQQAPQSWAVSLGGTNQGVVYFPPGEYRSLAGVQLNATESNVRLNFDPGALVRPAAHTAANLFIFGQAGSVVTNVTVTAGSECSATIPTSDGSHIWHDTGQRGNSQSVYRTYNGKGVAGMPNITLGAQTGWDLGQLKRMWVLDLDPWGDPATTADNFDQGVAGFQVANASNVQIANIVSYQNAARLVNANGSSAGLVPDATSQNPVVLTAPTWGQYPDHNYPAPVNIRVANLYDVLAPSGYGPTQVRVCSDCHFNHIFSHGGVAMRWETDGGGDQDKGCLGPGASGTANDMYGMDGNAALFLTPHCRQNGAVTATNVRALNEYWAISIGVPESSENSLAGFSSVTIKTVDVCGTGTGSADYAQNPDPHNHTWAPSASTVAVTASQPYVSGSLRWSWPAPPQDHSLPTSPLPTGVSWTAGNRACTE